MIQSRIQPLHTSERIMEWLCMCAPDESSSEPQKMVYIACTSTILSLNAMHLSASLAFAVKYIHTDFDGSVFAIMDVCGQIGMFYSSVAAIKMRYQIRDIYTELSAIYDAREFENSEIKLIIC